MNRTHLWAFTAFVALVPPATAAQITAANLPPAASHKVDFEKSVQPILRKSCYSCHGPEQEEGGLRLDVRQRAMDGGDNGKVIKPGKSGESRLIHLVAGADKETGLMPPDGEGTPLSNEQIGLLRAWIDQGAMWPDSAAAAGDRKGADHWAFQPPMRPALPRVNDRQWLQNPIDAFVLARLEKDGIAPSPAADKAMLMRRLYLDVLGVAPSPEEFRRFMSDTQPGAYERLVQRVLASPHYGERWGRHWLDLARYADSDGYEKDRPRPFAWRYRSWVINALNADMPFDEFSVKQIAGDMLPNATPHDRVASGFHRNTLHNTEGGTDQEEDRVKKTVDRTNTVGTIWLGLTVGCAECHSHKYDPITQREYYSFYALFNNINEQDIEAPLPGLNATKTKAQAVTESGRRQTRVHIRGNFLDKGDVVPSGTFEVLPGLQSRGQTADRLDVARWIVSGENPLTARVTVNRIWQRYFGRGLVNTVDDFGSQGEPPSHPQLLDWLACELVESGWQLKHIHRLIVTSAAYRQTSAARTDLQQRDPENVLLARQNRRRVEAEIIRDLALSVSGLLDRRVGGESVRPPQPAEYSKLTYANSAKWQVSKGGDRYRRGLYTFFQRTSPYPMLMTFDSPDSTVCTARRSSSNTPLQALTVWNDPAFFECAQQLGLRIVREVAREQFDETELIRQRARHGFILCLAREPNAEELDAVIELYREQRSLTQQDEAAAKSIVGTNALIDGDSTAETAAWVMVARTLMNLDEFVTKE